MAVPAEPDSSDPAAVVEYVVAGARAYAGGSPYFDQAAIRALAERDVARARSYASTLVNHYAIEFDWPARGGFGDIAAPAGKLATRSDQDEASGNPGLGVRRGAPAASAAAKPRKSSLTPIDLK